MSSNNPQDSTGRMSLSVFFIFPLNTEFGQAVEFGFRFVLKLVI